MFLSAISHLAPPPPMMMTIIYFKDSGRAEEELEPMRMIYFKYCRRAEEELERSDVKQSTQI